MCAAIPVDILKQQGQLVQTEIADKLAVRPNTKHVAWWIVHLEVDVNIIGTVAGTVTNIYFQIIYLAVIV